MNNSCGCQNRDCNCGSNSGFVFGLLCGAVIGAIIAIIIYKNNKTDVFEILSQKIKDFFDNLAKTNTSKNPPTNENSSKSKTLPKKILATSTIIPIKQEITPIFVKAKKVAPKTFIKPKK
jgi:Na+/glutamate symporter